MLIDLNKMKSGEKGVISSLAGSQNLIQRLHNLGIRPGKKITKISNHFWKGPVTIQIDRTKVALGFGMAGKVLVEVERVKDEREKSKK